VHGLNPAHGFATGHGPRPQLGLASPRGAACAGACGAVTALEVAVVARSPASRRWPRHGHVLSMRASGVRGTHRAWIRGQRLTGEVGHQRGASVVEKQRHSNDGDGSGGRRQSLRLDKV
jgi:hypothetical protein